MGCEHGGQGVGCSRAARPGIWGHLSGAFHLKWRYAAPFRPLRRERYALRLRVPRSDSQLKNRNPPATVTVHRPTRNTKRASPPTTRATSPPSHQAMPARPPLATHINPPEAAPCCSDVSRPHSAHSILRLLASEIVGPLVAWEWPRIQVHERSSDA